MRHWQRRQEAFYLCDLCIYPCSQLSISTLHPRPSFPLSFLGNLKPLSAPNALEPESPPLKIGSLQRVLEYLASHDESLSSSTSHLFSRTLLFNLLCHSNTLSPISSLMYFVHTVYIPFRVKSEISTNLLLCHAVNNFSALLFQHSALCLSVYIITIPSWKKDFKLSLPW